MSSGRIEALLVGAKTRFGWSEIIVILLPVLIEMLQKWLESCAGTEDEAVELLTDPRPIQVLIAQRAVLSQLRRKTSLSPKDRRVEANRIIFDVIEHADADPEAVVEAYREAVG